MKFLPLLWAALGRKPIRTVLTMLSVTVAFLLYGILQGVTAGFDHAIDRLTDSSRLMIQNRANIIAALPLSYRARIEKVDGVREVGIFNFVDAYFQDPQHEVDANAVDISHLGAVSEAIVTDEAVEAMRRTRNGAIIGPELVDVYGWKIGDRVPLKSRFWARKDGASAWEFDIVGVYSLPEGAFPADGAFFINYDYFDEARAGGNGTVTFYAAKIDDPAHAARIAADIDELFANSSDETLTQKQSDYIHAQIARAGNINYIVNAIASAVLFALLFVTGSTMMQSIRERIPELAVLKTYGYSDYAVAGLVVGEALLLCVTAAGLGLGIAALVFPSVYDALGIAALPLETIVYAYGFALAVALALASALPPAWRAQRLNIVDALAGR